LIVLDTHAFVWMVDGGERLSPAARRAIAADAEPALSVASIQEIAYLQARGRLALDRPLERWIGDALGVHGARVLAPTVATALRAGQLDPAEFHGDPADRLIYATAVEHDARLITADQRLRDADPARTVW
jgi:PIN domain nuclease of toxin-antitoxin system